MNKDAPKLVLDVATGTGDLKHCGTKKGTGAEVVGLDLSQQMLNVGIDKIKKLNLDQNINAKKEMQKIQPLRIINLMQFPLHIWSKKFRKI